MTQFNYALDRKDYTLRNALLWGNCRGHFQEAARGTLGHRAVHVIIAAIEVLPIISQIASLFERMIVRRYGDQAFDLISELPPDLFRLIFSLARADLASITLVSRKWKEMSYDDVLYKMIVPSFRFGEEAWKKHIGTPEPETLLPLCVFKDIERGEGYLTWVTETVEVVRQDGTTEKEFVDPDTIGELVKNPKEGHKTGYHPQAWRRAIDEKRPRERSHWVWIQKEPIGKGRSYEKQQLLAKAQSIEEGATNGADISGLRDTIVTAFMEKVRSGKDCFEAGRLSILQLVGLLQTDICVKEQTDSLQILLAFEAAGLNVHTSLVPLLGEVAGAAVAVVVARKSFGRARKDPPK